MADLQAEGSERESLVKVRRIWAQDVAVSAAVLRLRLQAAMRRLESRGSVDPVLEATAQGVSILLRRATAAAYRRDPVPTRWSNWWRGTLVEAAYQHLHAAEAEIIALYDDDEIAAEVPEAVARAEVALHRDDPRRQQALSLCEHPLGTVPRQVLRKTIEVGHGAADRQHSRVRSFRNIVLLSAIAITLFVAVFVVVVVLNPTAVPFCFTQTSQGGVTTTACPTGPVVSSRDVWVVTLLGLLGGALAAAVSIRSLRGTSTPYNLPAALAVLKVPTGALTAIGGLIVVRGGFVPGLSALDSQEQILAYALVFGYSQQLLTGLIDRQARTVLDSVPSKDVAVERPMAVGPMGPMMEPGTGAPAQRSAREASGETARSSAPASNQPADVSGAASLPSV